MSRFLQTVTNDVLFIVNPKQIRQLRCLGQVGLSVCSRAEYELLCQSFIKSQPVVIVTSCTLRYNSYCFMCTVDNELYPQPI